MNELSEKILLVAAGAAVGVLGYVAWKNRDKLAPMVESAIREGKEFLEKQMPGSTDGQAPEEG